MPSLLTATASRFTSKEAPLLVPLYDQRFGPWQIAGDGSFVCGAAVDAELSIQQASIRQRHCRLDFQQGCLTLVRLDGPVWVNEVPVHADAILEPDDMVSLGSWTMRVLAADPLRPPTAETDGVSRRPYLLGAETPEVIFTGGSDRRFHEVFPRVRDNVRAATPQYRQPAAGSDRTSDAEIRQLLEREAEAARRETKLRCEEQRLAELLAELEQARAELQQEQQQEQLLTALQSADRQQLEQDRQLATQRLAEASAIRSDAEAMLSNLLRERQELTELSAQLQQQRAQLTEETARQQSALAAARTELNCQQQQLEQQLQAAGLRIQAAEQQLAAIDTQRSDLASQQHQLQAAAEAVAHAQQQLETRQQALQVREVALDERARRIQQASLNRATVDTQSLLLQSHLETRSAEIETRGKELAERTAELAQRESELAERTAQLCVWRRRHAARLTEQQKQQDALSLELRQQKSALRLRTRELEALETSLNQRTAVISADLADQKDRESELQLELENARSQQALISQQLTAALMTCEQLRSTRETLLAAQGTIRQRDLQLLDLQQTVNAAANSLAERDSLIQELRQQLLHVLSERHPKFAPASADSSDILSSEEIWRHSDEATELFVPPADSPSQPDTAAMQESAGEHPAESTEPVLAAAPAQIAEFPEQPEGSNALPNVSSPIPANESLLLQLPPGVLNQELVRLLQLSQPETTKPPLTDKSTETSGDTENFSSGSTVPLLDEATARMLEESAPEVRSHIEKLLHDRRRTEDETEDMPAQKPTTSARRPQARPAGRLDSDEPGAKNRTPTSYIALYNDGKLSLTSDQPALDVAAEAADRMSGNAPAPEPVSSADAPAIPSRTADELVQYRRRANTNATINQHLQQMRKLSAEASQTAIIRHSMRRHRKGFLIRIAAIVIGMLAVVWSPPWLWLWTKNPTLTVWGPLAFFAVTCLELIRKLVIVLMLERKKVVAPVNQQRPVIPRPEIPLSATEIEPEIDDQHPLL